MDAMIGLLHRTAEFLLPKYCGLGTSSAKAHGSGEVCSSQSLKHRQPSLLGCCQKSLLNANTKLNPRLSKRHRELATANSATTRPRIARI